MISSSTWMVQVTVITSMISSSTSMVQVTVLPSGLVSVYSRTDPPPVRDKISQKISLSYTYKSYIQFLVYFIWLYHFFSSGQPPCVTIVDMQNFIDASPQHMTNYKFYNFPCFICMSHVTYRLYSIIFYEAKFHKIVDETIISEKRILILFLKIVLSANARLF